MTNQQINAAIAEACGWNAVCIDGGSGFYKGFDNGAELRPDLPDYCNDLNAMHEAEKMLTDANMFVMAHHIERLVSAKGQHYFHATARQRAEAFLLTLGKWEATDKESLTVQQATTEKSSAVQSTSSGGSGRASTYGGNELGIAGATWPPEARITVNGKTFFLADINKEMTE